MKKLTKIFYCNVALLLLVLFLVGCAGGISEESEADPSVNDSALESEEETDKIDESNQLEKKENELESTTESEEASGGDSNETEVTKNEESINTSESEEENPLAKYSSEAIEYARVWLQFGALKDVDELYVQHIPAGTPLNPDDETSASYPEDVIQLAGGRLVAGSVTYSGNGNGTINIYNVPLRWDGQYPAGEQFYKDIINNTKLEYVDPGKDEEVIKLIKKLNLD